MSRKNFLFCDTAKGADASALCFSMIETAKRNGLDPFGYLLFLLQELPKLGKPPAEEPLERIFPCRTQFLYIAILLDSLLGISVSRYSIF